MTKTSAWITEDNYLGVIGADSFDEMVAAIMASRDTLDGLTGDYEVTTEEQVRDLLDPDMVRPVKIPTAILHWERWDGSQVRRLPSLDARPGRSFVKVLGINLDEVSA